MTILERLCASGGPEVLIPMLELSCVIWPEPICVCPGFDDHLCTTEDGRTLLFVGSPLAISLPKKDASGIQNLIFAIDNITGHPQRRVDEALAADAQVFLTLRKYLSTDLSYPAEMPYRLIVRGGRCERSQVQITAGYHALTDYAWPRDIYDSNFAPALKYLQ